MYTPIRRFLALGIFALLYFTQDASGQDSGKALDKYILEAFTQNEGLKEQGFNLDKAFAALSEAKAMFMPTVSVQGSYTKAAGGRTIDVPVGDLVNPIYTALNQLTGSSKYSLLQNESFLLNPNNFYDAKLHTTVPLINAEINYNKEIKKQMITVQQASLNVYKRALVKDIKTAYYRYFQAIQTLSAYQSNGLLVKENIRENESMLRNGIRNGTALLRSQTEAEKNNTAILQTRVTIANARSYFNFLLNRPLQDSILLDSDLTAGLALPTPDTLQGIKSREELIQLRSLQKAYLLDYKSQRAGIIPKLNTFIDLGSQGFNFDLNDKTRYYLWGISLQWDIITGGQRKARAAQSQASYHAATAQLSETAQSLQLQLSQSFNNYTSATASLKNALSQLVFSNKYYNDQLKAYKAGQLLYLELVDAQNQLTGARLQVAQTQADLQIAIAELERDQATYPINNNAN